MSIASRITSIEGHIEDIYDTMALGGDTTSNKNIVNINTEIKREYKNFLANGTDTLWNNWEKVSGSGETLSLTPTIKGKMKVDLKGNTQQNGTPTPDTPIPVQVVSGDNTIKVEGKNLVNIYGSYVKREIATYANISQNNETLSYSVIGNIAGYLGFVIPVTIGQNYTISFTNLTGMIYLVELDSAITEVNTNYGLPCSSGYSFTATKSYVGIWLVVGSISNYSGSVSNLMLRLSSTSDTYEPYVSQTYPISLGNIELCKIGTYQDSIVKDNGKWYLHKEIGKVVLDGSENWTDFFSTTGFYRYTPTVASLNTTDTINCICNYYKGTTRNEIRGLSLSANNKCSIYSTELVLVNTSITSINDFKTWLSTHNTIVYYVLATPTYEEIEDTTLLSQLNNLYNANSYEETTNVSQVNDDMPFILDITALKEMS